MSEDVPEKIGYNINLKETVTIFKGIYNYTNGFFRETEIDGGMAYEYLSIFGSIILGGDIEVETESILSLATDENNIIDLNGRSLSFIDSSRGIDLSSRYLMIDIVGKIIGGSDSEIILDNKNLTLNIFGNNTYSGKTNVNNGILGVHLSKNKEKPLGESVLTINQSAGNNGKFEMSVLKENHTFDNKIIILGIGSIDAMALAVENEYPNAAIDVYHNIGAKSVLTFADLNIWGAAYLYQEDFAISAGVSQVGLTDISSLKLFDVTGKTVACDMLRFGILDDDKFLLTDDAEIAHFIVDMDKDGCAIGQYVTDKDKTVAKDVDEEKAKVKAPNTVIKLDLNDPFMLMLMGLLSIVSIVVLKKKITSK